MDLRQLQCAVSVAKHENFTRAAASLRIAQPALSAQIRNLERDLGVQLFERTTRRVRLTPAGSSFVKRAQQILADVETTAREMANYSGAIRGTVQIGAWFSVNPPLPGVLAGFLLAHPEVSIQIREESSDVMLDQLRSGELDVALITLCEGLNFKDIEQVVYVREPFVLQVSTSSPMAGLKRPRIRDLADEPLILQKPGSALRNLIEQAFKNNACVPRVAVETSQTAAIRDLVAVGIGSAILPLSLAEPATASVKTLNLIDPPSRVSALAWRRGLQLPATRAFVDYARRHLLAPEAFSELQPRLPPRG